MTEREKRELIEAALLATVTRGAPWPIDPDEVSFDLSAKLEVSKRYVERYSDDIDRASGNVWERIHDSVAEVADMFDTGNYHDSETDMRNLLKREGLIEG